MSKELNHGWDMSGESVLGLWMFDDKNGWVQISPEDIETKNIIFDPAIQAQDREMITNILQDLQGIGTTVSPQALVDILRNKKSDIYGQQVQLTFNDNGIMNIIDKPLQINSSHCVKKAGDIPDISSGTLSFDDSSGKNSEVYSKLLEHMKKSLKDYISTKPKVSDKFKQNKETHWVETEKVASDREWLEEMFNKDSYKNEGI